MLTDGTWTYSWKHGRQLASMSDGTDTWQFTYNADGLRTEKTNGTTTYNYVYSGTTLTHLTVGNDTLHFSYGADGRPMTVTYNGTVYFYVTNLQGDVVAIADSTGAKVVNYSYDAWGNPLATTGTLASALGAVNPLRYRGYVYDAETNLYYVISRYYNPEIGRWVNADSLISTGQGIVSNNMFTYCLNNPVLYVDSNGNSATLPPMIENGLNLPASGGIPVEINGTTYYYAVDIQNGELYEYWFNSNGDLVWGRHHSNHNKPKKHSNPHDHKGGKDKDGNNTLVDGPQPVDNNFHAPDKSEYQEENRKAFGYVATGAMAGVLVYQIFKWLIATILAPASGGTSYAAAALVP